MAPPTYRPQEVGVVETKNVVAGSGRGTWLKVIWLQPGKGAWPKTLQSETLTKPDVGVVSTGSDRKFEMGLIGWGLKCAVQVPNQRPVVWRPGT